MPQQLLRVLIHDGTGEGAALIRSEIILLSPTTTDKLLEIGARINFLVIRGQVIENGR